MTCRGCGGLLATFRRNMFPGADRAVWVRQAGKAMAPAWTTGPDGVDKVHLLCRRCGNNPQVRRERIEAALDAVYAQHGPLGHASVAL